MRSNPSSFLRYALIFLSCILFGIAGCKDLKKDIGSDSSLLIQNVTVIDAVSGRRENVDVFISGETIKSVTDYDKAQHAATLTIDGTGKYLIPGLWDAHVHLAYSPEITYETFFPLSLAHGVTSLRDTGGHLNLLAPAIKEARSNKLTPDLYFAGPLIDGPERIYAGQSATTPDLSVGVTTEKQAEDMVDSLVSSGASLIKAYEMLSPEAFKAVAKRAEHHGIPLAVHTPLSMTVLESIEAGANDMQHLRNIEFDCASNSQALKTERQKMLNANAADTPAALRRQIHDAMRAIAIPNQDEGRCKAVIDALATNNVYQTPTLVISRFFSRKLFADDNYRASFDLMPTAVAQAWKERSTPLREVPVSAQTAAYDSWLMDMIPRLHDGGVPIMAGTDAPIGFLTPGVSLHEELTELVKAGLTPLQALEAATLTPAKFFKIENQLGLIGENMRADLVLLNEDPLEDIRNIGSIHAVIKRGHWLDRETLEALKMQPQTLYD